jgi:hypothetical protein
MALYGSCDTNVVVNDFKEAAQDVVDEINAGAHRPGFPSVKTRSLSKIN